jgi:hypothetical protein
MAKFALVRDWPLKKNPPPDWFSGISSSGTIVYAKRNRKGSQFVRITARREWKNRTG